MPLGKALNIFSMIIATASASEKDGKYYIQVSLHECLHELQKCCYTTELIFLKELVLIKQVR